MTIVVQDIICPRCTNTYAPSKAVCRNCGSQSIEMQVFQGGQVVRGGETQAINKTRAVCQKCKCANRHNCQKCGTNLDGLMQEISLRQHNTSTTMTVLFVLFLMLVGVVLFVRAVN